MHRSLSSHLCLAAACLALLLPGCQSPQTSPDFTAIRVSNHRGETLAEYVARGPVLSDEQGLKIRAVERRTVEPHPSTTRYPYGWNTLVIGPRIQRWPTHKPNWLAESDGDDGSGD